MEGGWVQGEGGEGVKHHNYTCTSSVENSVIVYLLICLQSGEGIALNLTPPPPPQKNLHNMTLPFKDAFSKYQNSSDDSVCNKKHTQNQDMAYR